MNKEHLQKKKKSTKIVLNLLKTFEIAILKSKKSEFVLIAQLD